MGDRLSWSHCTNETFLAAQKQQKSLRTVKFNIGSFMDMSVEDTKENIN